MGKARRRYGRQHAKDQLLGHFSKASLLRRYLAAGLSARNGGVSVLTGPASGGRHGVGGKRIRSCSGRCWLVTWLGSDAACRPLTGLVQVTFILAAAAAVAATLRHRRFRCLAGLAAGAVTAGRRPALPGVPVRPAAQRRRYMARGLGHPVGRAPGSHRHDGRAGQRPRPPRRPGDQGRRRDRAAGHGPGRGQLARSATRAADHGRPPSAAVGRSTRAASRRDRPPVPAGGQRNDRERRAALADRLQWLPTGCPSYLAGPPCSCYRAEAMSNATPGRAGPGRRRRPLCATQPR